jgi:hypothetical protein
LAETQFFAAFCHRYGTIIVGQEAHWLSVLRTDNASMPRYSKADAHSRNGTKRIARASSFAALTGAAKMH